MSPTPWTIWEQNCPYNGKRRIDEINNTIDCLKTELLMNDIVLKNEIDLRINSDYHRELVAAELYKERLEALANSSRSQIWRVQTGNSPLQANDFHLDYDSWNPKRMKYGAGYSQNRAFNTIQKSKNTKPIKKAVPSKPTTTKVKTSVASSKNTATTFQPLDKSRTTLKTIPAVKSVSGQTMASITANSKIGNTLPVKNIPTTQVGVATVQTQASVTATKGVAASTTSTAYVNACSVKREPNIDKNELTQNIPSLLSCDLSRIKVEFDEAENIFGNYKNNLMEPLNNLAVKIKTEPATDEDAMVDDLANSL